MTQSIRIAQHIADLIVDQTEFSDQIKGVRRFPTSMFEQLTIQMEVGGNNTTKAYIWLNQDVDATDFRTKVESWIAAQREGDGLLAELDPGIVITVN